jgi:hypothetical protein
MPWIGEILLLLIFEGWQKVFDKINVILWIGTGNARRSAYWPSAASYSSEGLARLGPVEKTLPPTPWKCGTRRCGGSNSEMVNPGGGGSARRNPSTAWPFVTGAGIQSARSRWVLSRMPGYGTGQRNGIIQTDCATAGFRWHFFFPDMLGFLTDCWLFRALVGARRNWWALGITRTLALEEAWQGLKLKLNTLLWTIKPSFFCSKNWIYFPFYD